MMGCSSSDKECFDWEDKPHPVTVGKGFWMGQTEVTQEAYERVTGTNPSLYKGARLPGAHLPVDQIGWDDARKYCEAAGMRTASSRTGVGVRGSRGKRRASIWRDRRDRLVRFQQRRSNSRSWPETAECVWLVRHDRKHVGVGGCFLRVRQENSARWILFQYSTGSASIEPIVGDTGYTAPEYGRALCG